jgi:nitrite reductase/ring-hydroxylating ferredoxin subunit
MTSPGVFTVLAGLRACWHPVGFAAALTDTPRPADLLGEPLVLWRGTDGGVRVMSYRCVHRGTALSLGTVRGDQIVCPYHGWRYDADGRCWSAGHCVAAGFYAVGADSALGMVATQARGRWPHAVEETISPARHVPAAYFNGISCAPAAGCVAAGGYQPTSATSAPFTVLFAADRWRDASAIKQPSNGASAEQAGPCAISCLHDCYCAVGGDYKDAKGAYMPMVATT